MGSLPIAFPHLHAAICARFPSGSEGFEGFVRDLFSEATGQRFRIAKSGPQGGIDVLTDPAEAGLVVGIEGKRYGTSTALSLGELKAKLVDAIDTYPDLDVWVLATTRSIDSGDAGKLVRLGERSGVNVIVLDWQGTGTSLPQLAILCALSPTAIDRYFSNGPDVLEDIEAIRTSGFFPRESDRLIVQLRMADIGYAQACAAVRDWTRRRMSSVATARDSFDSPVNIEETGVRRVRRTTVCDALDQWWNNEPFRPAVVLGEEGIGKTWATAAWLLERAEHDSGFPMFVLVPARDVKSTDGLGLTAAVIHKATNIRSTDFWRRRLSRWLSAASSWPRLLVVVDGLNQHWEFRRWADLVLSLTTYPEERRIAVAMICRPEYWRSELKALWPSVKPSPAEIPILPFSEQELDEALALYEVRRDELPAKLLALMRVPRLCQIAVERRHELIDSGDITAERLIFEDWRFRSQSAISAMSHEEFVAFIAGLGRTLLAAPPSGLDLSRRELLDELRKDSGKDPKDLTGIISEIVDGRWFEPLAAPNRFRLRADRLPHVLGLALNAELARAETRQRADDIIGMHLEPYQDADTATAILRSASVIAFINETPRHTRCALIRRWLSSRNFAAADFEEFWRLIAVDPDAMLDVADELWFGPNSGIRQIEIFGKGFANAHQKHGVVAAVESRLTEWFSRYWPDPFLGEMSGPIRENAQTIERRANTINRAETWIVDEARANLGFRVTRHDGTRQAIGSANAVSLMSWLPRAPMIRPLTAWALTHAILGSVMRQRNALHWLLRANPYDAKEAESAVLLASRNLIALGNATGHAAAMALLDALASPAARALRDAEAHDTDSEPPWVDPSRTLFVDEEGYYRWDPDHESTTTRASVAPLFALRELAEVAIDPSARLADSDIERIRSIADSVTDERLLQWLTQGPGDDSHGRLPLARWTPDRLAKLERQCLALALDCAWVSDGTREPATAKRAAPARTYAPALAASISGLLLILDDDDVTRWRELSAGIPRDGSATEEDDEFLIATLVGQSAADQIASLSPAPPRPELLKRLQRLLAMPTESDFARIASGMDTTQPDETILRWLGYLVAANRQAMPRGWPPLIALLRHASAQVRAQAMRIAFLADDIEAANALESAGWSCVDRIAEEAALGSLLLCHSTAAKDGQVVDRLVPETCGLAATLSPDAPVYFQKFSQYIDAELDLVFQNQSRSLPRNSFAYVFGWDLLVKQNPDLLRRAFGLPAAKPHRVSMFSFFDRFPLVDAVRALAKIEPRAAADFMVQAIADENAGPVKNGRITELSMRLTGPDGERCAEFLIARADNDEALFTVARLAQKFGHTNWLLRRIRTDLSRPHAALIARGVTLAGFLSASPQADALWQEHLAVAPPTGWLATVYAEAKASRASDQAAKHWYEVFANASSNAEAFGAHALLQASCDARASLEERLPSDETLAGWSARKRAHWIIGAQARADAASKKSEQRKKRFLGTEIPGSAFFQHIRLAADSDPTDDDSPY